MVEGLHVQLHHGHRTNHQLSDALAGSLEETNLGITDIYALTTVLLKGAGLHFNLS